MDCNHEHNNGLDLLNMTNKDLERELIKMNKEQLSIIRDMSYYYLFSNTLEILNLLSNEKLLVEFIINNKEKEKLVNRCKMIIELFKNYHSNISEEERKERVNTLVTQRKELYNMYITLYGYEIEMSYIKEIFEYEILKRTWNKQYENFAVDEKDIDYTINRISHILNYNKLNHYSFIELVSNILSVIPFRMSKHKYFDVVKSTLMRNLNSYPVNIAEDQMERYKMLFNSRLTGDFGILFDSYFTSVQKYNNIDLKVKSSEELEDAYKEITKLYFEISKLRTFIQNLGITTNRLIALYLSLKEVPITLEFQNYFNKWKQFEENNDEKWLKTILKNSDNELMDKEKQLLDKVQSFERILQESAKREILLNENINQDVKYIRELLIYYNDVNFNKHEVLFPNNYEIIEGNYLDQLADNLIKYIDRSMQNMSNLERKIRMRRLLALIELPFNDIGEFLSFIEYSLDNNMVANWELAFSLEGINQLLDNYDEHTKRH